MLQDIRFGLRLLLRSPWLSSTAILSLAIGIGATTAVFTVINAALVKALPYPDVDRLIAVTRRGTRYFSLSEYRDLQAGEKAIEHMAAVESRDFVLGGHGHPEQVRGHRVGAAFPKLVGLDSTLMPVAGRPFGSADFEPGHPAVVLISHRLWVRRFGSDPAVVGRPMTIDAASATIAGVLPPAFDLFPNSDLLEPLVLPASAANERLYRHLEVLGRLPLDVPAGRAAAMLMAAMAREPDAKPIEFVFLREFLVKDVRRVLLTLWAMTGLVLAVACLNFANLLTARAAARQQELAVRASLGGRRLRLARQLVIEALVLVMFGGALGLVLAQFGAGLLVGALPQQFLGAGGVGLDGPILGFALTLAALCGVAFSALPALRMSAAAERHGTLLSIGALRSRSFAMRRTHTLIAAAQVALTFALLVGAGLFVRSFWQLARVDPGYEARGAVTLQFDLPASGYKDSPGVGRFTDALAERLRALPGVQAVGETSNLPLGETGMEFRAFAVENGPTEVGPAEIAPPGLPPPPPPPGPPAGAPLQTLRFFQALHVKVGPGFFDAMRIPLLAGRDFTTADRQGAPPVVMVNRAFADRYFPDGDPIGRRIRLTPLTPWMTVVGVVGNIRRFARDDAHRSEFYRPYAQAGAARPSDGPGDIRAVTSVMFVVRTLRAPDDLARSARGIVATLDPALPVAEVGTLQGALDDAVAQQRLLLRLFVAFSIATLIVAAVGVYGVTTYVVSRREHEMAVRVALGARPSSIEALVLSQSIPVIGIGLVLGLATAVVMSRSIGEYLFRVSSLDAWAYGFVAAILALVVVVASYLPARRAGRTDPLIALKGL